MGDRASRLLAVGLSHQTAPVEVRERLAFDDRAVQQALQELRGSGVVEEAMLLSTCNRVELYTVPTSDAAIRDWFGSRRGPNGARIDEHLYWHRGLEAVHHLFRVASSLDSLVIGEPQILGQVKNAIRLAQGESSLGRLLTPLTERTMRVAKRIRTETEIGRSRVGIGNAGVDLALQIFGSLKGKKAMLLGVGEMGRQVARALLNAGLDELVVANRTFERSVALAEEHSFVPIPWERLEDYLPRADIVVVATGAPKPIVSQAMVKRALRARRYRSIFVIDLAVPRNVAPDVDDLEDAYLFNVDDLSRVLEEGKAARQQAADVADQLVQAEAKKFVSSLGAAALNDQIGAVMAHAESIRQAELKRSRKLMEGLTEEQQKALDVMTRSMMKKVLHKPLIHARKAAGQGDEERANFLLTALKDD